MNLWQRVSDKVKELVSSLPYKKEGGEKFVPPKSRVIRKNYVKAVRSGLFAALKSKNQERILEFIETEEFDLEEVDAISGLTPLLFALKYEQWAAVEKLLELGANVNFKTNCGRYSAVGLAFEGKNVALAKRLLEKGAPIFVEPSAGAYEIEPLYHGVLSDDLGLMKWMLERVVSEKGFDSSRRSSFENVLGEYMGFAKSKDMIRLLLEYGGDINQGNL